MRQVSTIMREPTQAGSERLAPPWPEAVHSDRCPVCFLLRRDEFDELSHWVSGGECSNETFVGRSGLLSPEPVE